MTVGATSRLAWAAGVLLLGVVPITGCAGRETTVTTYRLQQQNTPSWVGVRLEDVLERWGEPSEKAPDGEGGTILTYRTKSNLRISTGVEERGGMRQRNEPGSGYPDMAVQPADKELERAPAAVFYVSPKRVVYRYTIRSDVLTSGKAPEPPRPVSDDPPGQTE
jgi:hypothetical protein